MKIDWMFTDSEVCFTLASPDSGWLVLGFNDRDAIDGARLIFVGSRDGEPYLAEHQVVRPGDHRPITELNLPSLHPRLESVTVIGNGTTAQICFPVGPSAGTKYELRRGRSVWLVIAYSVSDDLGHHSRMRRHLRVTL